MFLNGAVETCNPLGGRLNKNNDYHISLFFHVEYENYYLVIYFAFGFQHFRLPFRSLNVFSNQENSRGFRKLGLFIEQNWSLTSICNLMTVCIKAGILYKTGVGSVHVPCFIKHLPSLWNYTPSYMALIHWEVVISYFKLTQCWTGKHGAQMMAKLFQWGCL